MPLAVFPSRWGDRSAAKPMRLQRRRGSVRLVVSQGVLGKVSEGCPSHGRGAQWVRSCGRVRKRRGAARAFGRYRREQAISRTINVLLRADLTRDNGVSLWLRTWRVNLRIFHNRNCRHEERACGTLVRLRPRACPLQVCSGYVEEPVTRTLLKIFVLEKQSLALCLR